MGAALGALVLTSVLGGSTPALAFDDKPSTFDPLINIIGLGKDEDVEEERRLCFVAKGIVRGLAKKFGENIEVRETQCMHHGAGQCHLEITRRPALGSGGGYGVR